MVGVVFSYPSILLSSGEHASLTFSHLSDSFKISPLTHTKSPVAKTLFYDKGKKCNCHCWLHKDLIFPILIINDCPWHTCLELLMRWGEGTCPSAQTTDVLGCRGHILLLVSLTLMSTSESSTTQRPLKNWILSRIQMETGHRRLSFLVWPCLIFAEMSGFYGLNCVPPPPQNS